MVSTFSRSYRATISNILCSSTRDSRSAISAENFKSVGMPGGWRGAERNIERCRTHFRLNVQAQATSLSRTRGSAVSAVWKSMACPSPASTGTHPSGSSGIASALPLRVLPPPISTDATRLTHVIFRIRLPASRQDRARQREPKRPRAWATSHEVALVTVRTSASLASTAVRNSLDDEQVGSNTGRSRFSARFSCERVRQGCQDRGKPARIVSSQRPRMSVLGPCTIHECVRP